MYKYIMYNVMYNNFIFIKFINFDSLKYNVNKIDETYA